MSIAKVSVPPASATATSPDADDYLRADYVPPESPEQAQDGQNTTKQTDQNPDLNVSRGENGESGEKHRKTAQSADSTTSRSQKKSGKSAVRMVRNFRESDGSIYHLTTQTDDNGKESVKRDLIMSGVKVLAKARDKQNKQWGLVIEIIDSDKVRHEVIAPRRLLVGDGNELLGQLMDCDADLASGRQAKALIVEYFHTIKPEKRARHVDCTGWYENVFVLPEQVIGNSGDELVILQKSAADIGIGTAGTLTDWQQNIAKYTVGNSRMILAISMNFAGPLLEITGEEGGGINFVHVSTCGKTTTVRAGGSVWGGRLFVVTLRATSNGVEGQFRLHNDLCMIADELGEVQAAELGAIVYMGTNGRGKARMNRDGTAKKVDSFKLVLLTTGEKTIAQHMASKNLLTAAGQEIRLVDFPADAGKGHGVFEDLHGFANATAFAGHLNVATNKFYGTAGIEFLKKLTGGDREEIKKALKAIRTKWEAKYIPADAASQVQRVGRRFSLYAAAGEVSSIYGISGWAEGTALDGIGKCFKDWLEYRGSTDDLERNNLLAAVRLFFEQHGDSRFPVTNDSDSDNPDRIRTVNRAGFRKKAGDSFLYLVLPEVFKSELLKGFNRQWAIGILKEVDWLLPDLVTDRPDQSFYITGLGTKRVYVFSPAVLAGDS